MRIGQQVVVGDTKYTFTLPKGVNNLVIFDVHNDSPYNMGISFGRDTTITNCDYYTSPHGVLTGIIPPSIDKRSIGGVRWQGNIYIYTETPAGGGGTTNLANAPASSVTLIGYQAGYQPQGQIALNRMQTTANTVDTNAMGTNTVNNDGNPAGTVFVEATQLGNTAGSNVAIQNTGDVDFRQWVGSLLTSLLKIITGASPLVQLGKNVSLQQSDNNGIIGTLLRIDSSGNNIIQQHPTGQEFIFTDFNGNRLVVIDGTGHLVVNNDTSIRGRDNGGTAQALFKYDTSNNVLFVAGTSGFLKIQDNTTDTNFTAFSMANGLQMANSTGIIANVLGVDSSGNTYIQCHTTNNQVVFYDKTGAAIITITSAGKIILKNNTAIQMKNAAGTAVDILYTDASNETCLQIPAANKPILFKKSDGTTICGIDATNSTFQFNSGGTMKDMLYINSGSGETYFQAIGTGKIRIKDSSGGDLFSIDSSGNVRAKGTITASVTP
jgi:hypothetical protein